MPKKITIITVVYNAEKDIEKTILSVKNQTYKEIEYIIVDGKSTDNTLKIINEYINFISYIISEEDKGIYDAMNKGTKIANGEWILYLNAGDYLINNEIINDVFNAKDYNDYGVIYGNVIGVYKDYTIKYKPQPLNKIKYGKPFHHQAQFVKAELAKNYLFKLKYPICADHDFAYYYHNKVRYKYIDKNISYVKMMYGASKNNSIKTYYDTYRISYKYNKSIISFIIITINFIKALLVKNIIPKIIIKKLRVYRNE